MEKIILNGNDLTRHQVIDVAYNHARVTLDTSKISKSLDYITLKVKQKKIIYGVTTGFGSNADKLIETKDTVDLQLNLLRSHACGLGNPFSKEIVRAIMVIRLNTLLRGNSGVQKSTVDQLAFLLNNDIHPVIPEQGSVGASGDLCPLSHMALPLIGEGEIEYELQDKKEIEALQERKDENGKYYGVYRTADFLKTATARKIGFNATTLSNKEGLALNNGTTVMTAVGAIALHKAEQLLKVCTLSSALIFESLCARKNSFAYTKIHEARNHSGQIEIAQWLTKLLWKSDKERSNLININQKEILTHLINTNQIPNDVSDVLKELNSVAAEDEQKQIPTFVIDKLKYEGGKCKSDAAKLKEQNNNEETEESKKLSEKGDELSSVATILNFAKKKWIPQDSYSIRCVPQVFGASKTAIDHVISVVDKELNASVDNPLIFSEDGINGDVISGGNFHGQPIALVMDYLKLALAEMGNITERQINKMVDKNTNDCMESFLIYGTGLNNGLMIPQYAAAGIVSENKVLVHPASADSIPTCENTEDHVSMGLIAARQALQIAENVEKVTAIAIMTAFYAISMRLEEFKKVKMENSPEKTLAPATLEFYNAVKNSNKEFQKPTVTEDTKGFLQTDRYLSPEIKSIHANFGKFAAVADKYLK